MRWGGWSRGLGGLESGAWGWGREVGVGGLELGGGVGGVGVGGGGVGGLGSRGWGRGVGGGVGMVGVEGVGVGGLGSGSWGGCSWFEITLNVFRAGFKPI